MGNVRRAGIAGLFLVLAAPRAGVRREGGRVGMKRALAIVALLAGPAAAHEAPSGWSYDPECCSGFDCAWVAPGAVREVAGGYYVSIAPGTHPRVPMGSPPVSGVIRHGDPRIRASGDEHRHVCVLGGRILCIYVPPGGV